MSVEEKRKPALPTSHRLRRPGSKQRLKNRYVLIGLSLCLLVGGAALIAIEYPQYSAMYHRDVALGQAGTEHLRKAASLLASGPLDAQTVIQARHEFAAALPVFVQINNDLQSLPPMSTFIPVYGARLSAALHLVPVALELSRAGIMSCDLLSIFIAGSRKPTTQPGLTMADLTTIGQDLQRIKTAFKQAIDEANQVDTADLQFDPRLDKLFATFQQEAPMLQAWLDEADKLLPVLPTLLGIGVPAPYLIEVLDSTELRPGGGFIGNYGVATLSGGRLTSAGITDVDLLDKPFEAAGHSIPHPAAYSWFDIGASSWSFEDSNLDADFPTAARFGEQNYLLEGGKIPVQGVIAITPALIQHALTITGPIPMPEYHETITSQNLIARIHYHQLGPAGQGPDTVPSPDGHSSLRKRFTELLAEHFLAHVRQLSPIALAKFLRLLAASMYSKDLQIYFNSNAAEHLLQRFHLDAAIRSAGGDGLFVVDANIGVNKANDFIVNTLDDEVSIDAGGNVMHRTTLTYAWTLQGQNYGNPLYRDYSRVYVPPGSVLQAQNGWQPRGVSFAFGREVWAGYFTLTHGQTRSITLVWTVPGAAWKDASGWHYQYLVQRQAGAQWTLELHVALPACVVVENAWGGLVASGRKAASLTRSLNQDTSVGINYTC